MNSSFAQAAATLLVLGSLPVMAEPPIDFLARQASRESNAGAGAYQCWDDNLVGRCVSVGIDNYVDPATHVHEYTVVYASESMSSASEWEYRYLQCRVADLSSLQVSKFRAEFSPTELDMSSSACFTSGWRYSASDGSWVLFPFTGKVLVQGTWLSADRVSQGVSSNVEETVSAGQRRNTHCKTVQGSRMLSGGIVVGATSASFAEKEVTYHYSAYQAIECTEAMR